MRRMGRGVRFSTDSINFAILKPFDSGFMEMEIHSAGELPLVAERLLAYAGARRKLAFYGEIGAGKTTLIRAICRQLGTEEEATSPTFALVNTYSYRSDGREALVHHMDLYRVNRIEETLEFGIEEYLDDPYFCLIEWPEVIEALLPDDVIRVRISAAGESVRKIVFL